MPLRTVTDGPLFGKPEGTLPELTNMELDPDGYAEARGGTDKMKPEGGSVTAALSSGSFGWASAHQLRSPYGVVLKEAAGAGTGSLNYQLRGAPWGPFDSGAVNDSIYFGSDLPFPSITVSLSVAASWTVTIVYEYWNGSIWTALTTSATIDWTVLRTPQKAAFAVPAAWTSKAVGTAGAPAAVLKYLMRIRISVSTAIVTLPYIAWSYIRGSGIKTVYAALQSLDSGAATIYEYGQQGTTAHLASVVSGLKASAESPPRLSSYRGRLVAVDGTQAMTFDGDASRVLGVPGSSIPFTLARVAGGAGMDVGIYRYYAGVGYGPCDLTAVYSVTQGDVLPRWGVGQASLLIPTANPDPADANSAQTTAGNQAFRFTITGALNSAISSLFLYRTQDLTNVPIGQRSSFPAFLIQGFRITNGGAIEGSPYDDTNAQPLFPPTEAKTYSTSPPTGCKYATVYQNRLVLADDETVYWSDPFTPDIFSQKATNYVRFGKAQGGRIMGLMEFGDQVVVWTDTQTWGLTNLDLDVPVLFPIAMDVGCVAPDAIAAGDGHLIWPGRYGFYAWDGRPSGPVKVSDEFEITFGKMSWESHGGSRATICHGRYTVRLADPRLSVPGAAYRYRFDTGKWSIIELAGFSSTLFPIGTIDAPLGNANAGTAHPVWAKSDYSGTGDYNIYLGELTTQDNGTSYDCSATMHFPTPPNIMLRPNRVLAYYSAPDGWGTPQLDISSFTTIGGVQSNLVAGAPATGDDYSIIGGKFDEFGAGTTDLKVKFVATSAASGTVNRQRFYGAVLEGNWASVGRYAV